LHLSTETQAVSKYSNPFGLSQKWRISVLFLKHILTKASHSTSQKGAKCPQKVQNSSCRDASV